ncbi:hypothetical protein ACFHWD_03570 [Clostridium sp. MT-14]|uniref:hypothetical protein n=1 Tax=Clostridium sp. MT-14 TaxID=3348360 RepID=UPI0035F4A789
MYKDMCKILDEGKEGDFILEKYTITDKDWRASLEGIPNGEYIKLIDYRDCIMSNTPMEQRTNVSFVHKANGDVFIAGLGLGMIVLPVQEKENVKSITILEKYPEIIKLVGSQLPLNDKVKIIQGDVFDYEFPKGTKFDSIYFDIWNYINSDVYEEMKLLKKKYRKYKRMKKYNPNVFSSCWAEYQARYDRRLI